jgi:hemerythrin
MALLTWSHVCSVGVKSMDVQHGILLDTMNEIRQSLMTGCNSEQLDEQSSRLIEFARIHFASEEALLETHGFPGLPEHRAEHERLLAEIRVAVQRGDDGSTSVMRPLVSSLRTGYLEHIEEHDQQYGDWLNARGIY